MTEREELPLRELKNRRINTATHVKQLMNEQINILRKLIPATTKEQIEISKAIAYLSSVALTSIKDEVSAEVLARIEGIEAMIAEHNVKGR